VIPLYHLGPMSYALFVIRFADLEVQYDLVVFL
jgi:hypothetical protein